MGQLTRIELIRCLSHRDEGWGRGDYTAAVNSIFRSLTSIWHGLAIKCKSGSVFAACGGRELLRISRGPQWEEGRKLCYSVRYISARNKSEEGGREGGGFLSCPVELVLESSRVRGESSMWKVHSLHTTPEKWRPNRCLISRKHSHSPWKSACLIWWTMR